MLGKLLQVACIYERHLDLSMMRGQSLVRMDSAELSYCLCNVAAESVSPGVCTKSHEQHLEASCTSMRELGVLMQPVNSSSNR